MFDYMVVGAGFAGNVLAERLAMGRLATYKYYNMDQVVAQALAVFNKIRDANGPTVPEHRERANETSFARAVGGS
jgi:UDP-galactopyranose mutase